MKPKRIAIPSALAHQVRHQCDGACGNPSCREWSSSTHELHHIDGDRSNSTLENLILLCGNCHSKEQAGIITREEIEVWKSQAKLGRLPWPKKLLPLAVPTVRDNYGMVAGHVHVENLTIKQDKKSSGKAPPIPGTIGADADMRTYATYLAGRYIEWRKEGIKSGKDKRSFKPSSAHGILCEGYGANSALLIGQSRFFEWVAQAQSKIDHTVWGRMNFHRNYHTWEEHLAQRRGKKKVN